MAQDINALIAMAQSRNAQGAFDPNAQPQAQMDQIAALVRQGLISPLQAQQFMAQIQGARGQQAQPQANPMITAQAGQAPTMPPDPAAQRAQDNADLAAALRQPMIPPQGSPQSPQARFPQINMSPPTSPQNPNTGLPIYGGGGIRG